MPVPVAPGGDEPGSRIKRLRACVVLLDLHACRAHQRPSDRRPVQSGAEAIPASAATAAAGSQFTGWLGKCTGKANCQFTVNGQATLSATFATNGIGSPRIDVDGNGRYDALTDGLLIIRHLFGLTGASLIAGAVALDATRTTAAQISDFLVDIKPLLDIDGNLTADALTDGLLSLRYLFGLHGASYTDVAKGSPI